MNFKKHSPLFAPVELLDDCTQISLVQARDGRQKRNLFLKFGRPLQEISDLGRARVLRGLENRPSQRELTYQHAYGSDRIIEQHHELG